MDSSASAQVGASHPRSGGQHRLRSSGYEAVIASVGATLRVLHDDGGDLIVPFDADEERPAMRGALLAPWPNRTADGRYVFQGVEHQLPINEPERGNAAHGLVSWLDFVCIHETDDSVTLARVLEPVSGYPWRIRLEATFTLGDDGLTQRVVATNLSDDPAPMGIGGHPYVLAGVTRASAIDDWVLEVPADDLLATSPDRLLPVSRESVEGSSGMLDFRGSRPIRDTAINHAFGSLRRDAAGVARVRVTDGQGYGVEVACGPACQWVQIYTADEATGDARRAAVAVEPMTCPPDALNSGTDLTVVLPGQTTSTEWSIRRVRRG